MPADNRKGLQVGETVHVGIDGLKVSRVYRDDEGREWVDLVVPHLRYGPIDIRVTTAAIDADMIKITRTVPADGKPKQGEIWADRKGALYFVRNDGSRPDVVLVPESDGDELRASNYPWKQIHNSDDGPISRVSARPTRVATRHKADTIVAQQEQS